MSTKFWMTSLINLQKQYFCLVIICGHQGAICCDLLKSAFPKIEVARKVDLRTRWKNQNYVEIDGTGAFQGLMNTSRPFHVKTGKIDTSYLLVSNNLLEFFFFKSGSFWMKIIKITKKSNENLEMLKITKKLLKRWPIDPRA